MPLSTVEARAKAQECRDLSERAQMAEHRVMLEHMAETWDRIAATLQQKNGS